MHCMHGITLHLVFCISFGCWVADILMTSSLFSLWVSLAQNITWDFAAECWCYSLGGPRKILNALIHQYRKLLDKQGMDPSNLQLERHQEDL